METMIFVALAAFGAVGAVWLQRRQPSLVDGDVYRPASTDQRIKRLYERHESLHRMFLGLAVVNIGVLAVAGLLTVTDHIDGPPTWMLIAGVVFGGIPAVAVATIGHNAPGLIARPRIPIHLRPGANNGGNENGDGEGEGEEVARRWYRGLFAWFDNRMIALAITLGLAAVSLTMSALFALQHLIAATEFLGFDKPIGGIPPAMLIPGAFELLQMFLLAAAILTEIDIENMQAEASTVRVAELEAELELQALETELTARRLEGRKLKAEAEAEAEALVLKIESDSELLQQKRKAAKKTRVESGIREAAAELALEDQERAANAKMKAGEIASRVAEAETNNQLREIEAEIAATTRRVEAELAKQRAEAEGRLLMADASAEQQVLEAKAERTVERTKSRMRLEKMRTEGEIQRQESRFAAELEFETRKVALENEALEMQSEQQLLAQRHQLEAFKAALEAGEITPEQIDSGPIGVDPDPKALNSHQNVNGNGAKR